MAGITAQYYEDAYKNIWTDQRIMAITPFLFNLGSFSNFNWMTNEGAVYPQYDVLTNLPKVAGKPNGE